MFISFLWGLFVWGVFWQGGLLSRGFLSGGLCLGGFCPDTRKIYICRKGGDYDRVVNLMLITENNRKHYVAIKSLSRLL